MRMLWHGNKFYAFDFGAYEKNYDWWMVTQRREKKVDKVEDVRTCGWKKNKLLLKNLTEGNINIQKCEGYICVSFNAKTFL